MADLKVETDPYRKVVADSQKLLNRRRICAFWVSEQWSIFYWKHIAVFKVPG